jgi:hypothetical protein
MWFGSSIRLAAQAAALLMTVGGAQAFDDAKYPDLKGQWDRFAVDGLAGQPSFDQTKPWGRGQQAPLTPEYQAIFAASVADQIGGGHGNARDHARCVAAGMPFMMVAFRPLEFVITPGTTYILLEVETRGFKGPRIYDATGLPLHADNQSIFKERIRLDKDDPNLLHDEITVFDHALTRPWTVDKRYVRNTDGHADWPESICPEYNAQVFIGKENYYQSADGLLMPAKKGQTPPDLRYFNRE